MFGKKRKNSEGSISERDDIEAMMSEMLDKVHSSVPEKGEADDVVSSIKKCFDDNEWKYDFNPERNNFYIDFTGKAVNFKNLILARKDSICVYSKYEIQVIPEREVELLYKVNEINKDIYYGSFFIDKEYDSIVFRCTHRITESEVSPALVDSFFGMILDTVDDNGGFFKEILESRTVKNENNPMFN